jgi:hypothetical protein
LAAAQSDPDSPENTYREDHYRRIAYANERFSSGVRAGKPIADTCSSSGDHPMKSIRIPRAELMIVHPNKAADRPRRILGNSGATATWKILATTLARICRSERFRRYRQRWTPVKGCAGARPGRGLELSELHDLLRAQRFSNTNGTTLPAPLGGLSAGLDEFDISDRYFKVQRPPEHLKDLSAMVTARIVRNQIHMDYRFDFLRVTHDSVLVPITLQVANRDLSFKGKDGVQSAVLNLYGRITTLSGRVVQTFEDVVSRDFPDSLYQSSVNLSSIYQRSVPLRSGLYRLDVVLKDAQSGNVGVIDAALRVPLYEEESLDASSLILADQIRPVATSQVGQGPFVIGNYKVRPRINPEFSSADSMGIFLQLYNLKLDVQSHKSDVSVAYRIIKDHQQVWKQDESPEQLQQSREQITIERNLPLVSLAPGRYSLEVYVIDLLTNQTVTRTADFTVKPLPAAKPTSRNSSPPPLNYLEAMRARDPRLPETME